MIYIEQLYPVDGLAIRDTDAHASGPVSFAESGYSNGLIVLKNSLDQDVVVTAQGRGQWADSWQTIDSVTVASDASGSICVTSPWGEVRISSAAAGVPSSGVLIAEIDMAIGGSGAVTLTAGDLEIGAVEIKDATTTTRAVVDADGLEVHIDKALPAGTNAIGKLAANDGVDIGNVDVASVAAGEAHLGEVGAKTGLVEITLTLDTNIYASGDVLAVTQEIANAVRVAGGTAILQSLVLLDKDDQAGALDLLILQTTQNIGAINDPHAISDAEADEILTIIEIAAGDYYDLTNSQLVRMNGGDDGLGMVLKAAAASTSLFVAAISKDTKTYSASGIVLKLGFLMD